jgi:uncharacterized protein UPF0758
MVATAVTAPTTGGATRAAYHATVREMPSEERPRERLERYGASTLQTAELLAILLRVGTPQENVIELSSRLLREYKGLGGLLAADFAELCAVHGMGQAKTAQLKAALEIGRRLSVMAAAERPKIESPGDVAQLVILYTTISYLSLCVGSDVGSARRRPAFASGAARLCRRCLVPSATAYVRAHIRLYSN